MVEAYRFTRRLLGSNTPGGPRCDGSARRRRGPSRPAPSPGPDRSGGETEALPAAFHIMRETLDRLELPRLMRRGHGQRPYRCRRRNSGASSRRNAGTSTRTSAAPSGRWYSSIASNSESRRNGLVTCASAPALIAFRCLPGRRGPSPPRSAYAPVRGSAPMPGSAASPRSRRSSASARPSARGCSGPPAAAPAPLPLAATSSAHPVCDRYAGSARRSSPSPPPAGCAPPASLPRRRPRTAGTAFA